MKFTPEERKAALVAANMFEKEARDWRRNRWLSIAFVVIAAVLLYLMEGVTKGMHELLDFSQVEVEFAELPKTAEYNAARIDMLESTIGTRISLIRIEMLMLSGPLLFLVFSLFCVWQTFGGYRRDIEYLFFAKLARSVAEDGITEDDGVGSEE